MRDPLLLHRTETLARIEQDQRALRDAALRLRDSLVAQLQLGHHLARRPAAWLLGAVVVGFGLGLWTRTRPK